MTADMLPWIVAGASLIVLLVVVIAAVASARSHRQLRVAHEESIATKNEQIASLEAQLASLRESESIRFVDRYVAAKRGLEERIANLHEGLESVRIEQDKLLADMNDLGLSERERERETDRLLRDLNRATDQIKRLEMILREVANVGPMDVEPIRIELESRRELSTHIRDRLDRLNTQEHDRQAARRTRAHQLDQLNEDANRLRREIEITRTAASVVDGILGIDSDTRKRLARHASEQLDEALKSLGEAGHRSPISQFVDILERQRPERLLERGVPPVPPAVEVVEAAPAPAVAAPEPPVESVAGAASDRSHGTYWTRLP